MKTIGGNLLMFLHKDLPHQFNSEEDKVGEILVKIFKMDEFLRSNFVFGGYQKAY